MNRLRIFPKANSRKVRVKSRQHYGVIQKKPFDWARLWRSIYRILRYLFLIGLLLTILIGPYYGWQYLRENNLFFKIETVSVYGEMNYLPEERINELVKGAVGQNLIGLDMKQYQDQILTESWVKSVSLRRKWFHELEVHVEEEMPIAVWNETEMVDRDGETFVPSFIPNQEWVYLNGPKGRSDDVLKVYERIVARLNNTEFALKELILDETESWTIILDNNLMLIMGSEDLDQRLTRFLRQFPDRNVLDRIQHIDFRYKNGFSVKWKESSNSISIENKR